MNPEDVTPELLMIAQAAFSGRKPMADGTFALPSDRNPWMALHDALTAVLPAHERQVRERVAAETYETATYDAAREQVDDEIGHGSGCDWHTTNGGYCSCKVWPAACDGVSIAAERIAESARGES